MSLQGLGFAISVGVGLAAALYYFISQAAGQSPYRNNNNNSTQNQPPSENEPHTNTWHEGGRNTKPKRKRSMQTRMTDCVICYEEMNSDTILLECKHEFHSHCISKWLKDHSCCPLCRKIVMSSWY